MDRNCLRPSFRCQRVNTSSANTAVKSQRNKLGMRAEEEDFLNGISWPPRSYTCSFCKREFRSAQALGGHMNVHRRDRAMLRQYSPPAPPNTTHHHSDHFTNLNLNLHNSSPSPSPNPNPNLSPSSETSKWVAASNDNVLFGCLLDQGVSDLKTNSKAEIAKANVFERGHCCGDRWSKGEKIIGLDIEIGTNKDIDLELRLGYSA